MTVASYTRDQMQSTVEVYLNRSLDISFNTFFQLGCKRLNAELRHPLMLATETLAGSAFPYNLSTVNPAMEVYQVVMTRGSTVKELRYVDYEEYKRIDAVSSGGVPGVYSLVGNIIYVGPTPAATDSIDVTYYYKQDEEVGASETNTFTQSFGLLLLYAILIDVYLAYQDVERAEYYQGKYRELLATYNAEGWAAMAGPNMAVRNN